MTHLRSTVGSLLIIVIVASAVVSTGCTSTRRIATTPGSDTAADFGKIRPGDTVEVWMRDGSRDRFKVDRVVGEALVSRAGERYERADMKELKQHRFSHLKTWPLIGGVVVGTLFIVAQVALDDLLGSYPGRQ